MFQWTQIMLSLGNCLDGEILITETAGSFRDPQGTCPGQGIEEDVMQHTQLHSDIMTDSIPLHITREPQIQDGIFWRRLANGKWMGCLQALIALQVRAFDGAPNVVT